MEVDIEQLHRITGRTTRTLINALNDVTQGKKVLVVCASLQEATMMQKRFDHIVSAVYGSRYLTGSITFISNSEHNLAELRGGSKFDVVLHDHHAVEVALQKYFSEWSSLKK